MPRKTEHVSSGKDNLYEAYLHSRELLDKKERGNGVEKIREWVLETVLKNPSLLKHNDEFLNIVRAHGKYAGDQALKKYLAVYERAFAERAGGEFELGVLALDHPIDLYEGSRSHPKYVGTVMGPKKIVRNLTGGPDHVAMFRSKDGRYAAMHPMSPLQAAEELKSARMHDAKAKPRPKAYARGYDVPSSGSFAASAYHHSHSHRPSYGSSYGYSLPSYGSSYGYSLPSYGSSYHPSFASSAAFPSPSQGVFLHTQDTLRHELERGVQEHYARHAYHRALKRHGVDTSGTDHVHPDELKELHARITGGVHDDILHKELQNAKNKTPSIVSMLLAKH